MARSTWKFLWTTTDDLKYYYSFINPDFKYFPLSFRHKTINMLNYKYEYLVYQGKVLVEVDTQHYSLNTKLGMYTKTRKPFFFRSKKKR